VPVKRRVIEWLGPLGCEIHELYGASEGGATRISPSEWMERPGSVGLPWPGIEVRILDESSGERLPAGEQGLIYITPMAGRFEYRNDPEKTSQAWRDDAFTVGDIGYLDDDGYLFITDRASDMVLWGGVNIAPREVEEALYAHDGVVDCAVFGIPDERSGERLKAMVELRPGTDVTVEASSPSCAIASPTTRSPRSGSWSASCPATPPARSASASCATPTGRTATPASNRRRLRRPCRRPAGALRSCGDP
jgi:long-chain acyl-CoA synthetase